MMLPACPDASAGTVRSAPRCTWTRARTWSVSSWRSADARGAALIRMSRFAEEATMASTLSTWTIDPVLDFIGGPLGGRRPSHSHAVHRDPGQVAGLRPAVGGERSHRPRG